MLTTASTPKSNPAGAVRLSVQVPETASVEPTVHVPVLLSVKPRGGVPTAGFRRNVSAVIVNGAVPVFVTVTTDVPPRVVKVSVRAAPTPDRLPPVALVKLRTPVPDAMPVPVRLTGEPETVAPV